MTHLRHRHDGQPVCWPPERRLVWPTAEFDGSYEIENVNCRDCLDRQGADRFLANTLALTLCLLMVIAIYVIA